jgi:hypothetical protein
MIDRDDAQKCYTQQDSNINGLFTASQKIDRIYKISCAVAVRERKRPDLAKRLL